MHAFVISLPSDLERRAFMREQLERCHIEYEFFDAVRGSERIGDAIWYDDDAARRLEGRSLRPGEVGCALSHQAVYAEISRRGLDWSLVLEDDAIIHPELPAVLELLEARPATRPCVISVSRCDHYWPGSAKSVCGRFKIARPFLVREGSTAQSVGYVLSGRAATAMAFKNQPVHFPADSWGYYARDVDFFGIVPTLTLVKQKVDFGSTISANGTRLEFRPYRIRDLLWHGFKTYNPLGRALARAAKVVLRKAHP